MELDTEHGADPAGLPRQAYEIFTHEFHGFIVAESGVVLCAWQFRIPAVTCPAVLLILFILGAGGLAAFHPSALTLILAGRH
jgi:hypothetical protein